MAPLSRRLFLIRSSTAAAAAGVAASVPGVVGTPSGQPQRTLLEPTRL